MKFWKSVSHQFLNISTFIVFEAKSEAKLQGSSVSIADIMKLNISRYLKVVEESSERDRIACRKAIHEQDGSKAIV